MNQTNEPVAWICYEPQSNGTYYPLLSLGKPISLSVINVRPLGIVEPNTVTITAAEYAKLKEDAERYRYMRNESSIMLWDAQKWATSHRLDMLVDEAIDKAKEPA